MKAKVCRILLLSRLSLVLPSVLLFTSLLMAQTDQVRVIMDGPWTYVPDPTPSSNRIIAIAAVSTHHHPVRIFVGGQPEHPPETSGRPSGSFTLDISKLDSAKLKQCKPKGAGFYSPADQVDQSRIKALLARDVKSLPDLKSLPALYTISLPKPCSYATSGTSRVKIGSDPTVDEQVFTTQLILNYPVTAPAQATISEITEDQTETLTDILTFASDVQRKPPSISIVMNALGDGNDTNCDSHSRESFRQMAALFALKIKDAQFPSLDGNARQTDFDPNYFADCPVDLEDKRMQLAPEILSGIKGLRANLAGTGKGPADNPRTLLSILKHNLEVFWGPLGEPLVIQTELSEADLLLNLMAADRISRQKGSKGAQGAQEREHPGILVQTEVLVVAISAGSADCYGPQTNINGAIP